ncbi:MAG: MarR family transcriptional regulator [Clostridiales bacterium]|jgi:DNA-binding MarR family transcriptional regulator|nr:MarR family transcriptional regulator [Eubacteriales bacterium]MDH7567248.1 MarR family transcriptional regulator [Clostridiales bacterium]
MMLGQCNDDLGYLLNKASRLSKWRVNQKLGEIGLTFPQLVVIKHLFKSQGNSSDPFIFTPASIAEHLGYDRPTITGIIDRLAKQGLVLREVNPSDRRSQTISLTEKSKELIEKMNIFFEEVNDKSLEGFEKSEIKALKDYLLRIIGNLDEQKECADKER